MDKLVAFLLKKKVSLPAAFVIVYGGIIALMFGIIVATPEIPLPDEDFTLKTAVALGLLLVWAFLVIKGGTFKNPHRNV